MKRPNSWKSAGLGVVLCLSCDVTRSPETSETAIAREFFASTETPPPSARLGLVPVEFRKESSALLLATVDAQRLLVLADEDASAIAFFDAESGALRHRHELSCAPQQLVLDGSGDLFATHPRCNAVSRYRLHGDGNAFRLNEIERRSVASEPVALAVSAASDTLLSVSAWGKTLTQFTLPSFKQVHTVDLPREPRAVTLSEDGRQAFVAHAVGGVLSEVTLAAAHLPNAYRPDNAPELHSLSASNLTVRPPMHRHYKHFVDFDADFGFGTVRSRRVALRSRVSSTKLFAVQGFALAAMGERVWIPQAFSNPGDVQQIAHGYGAVGSPLPETLQDVAVFDTGEGTSNRDGKHFALIHGWSSAQKNLCRLPRAAALDESNHSLLVACIGSDRVIEFDAEARDPARTELTEWTVARGPSALTLDSSARRAYVWSRFAREISVLGLPPVDVGERPNELSLMGTQRRREPTLQGTLLSRFPVSFPAESDAQALALAGMAVFHRSNDPTISGDGRACASCHPSARDDGLSWRTAGELLTRQTPMLDGRIEGTAPYGWLGQHDTLEQHLENTVKNRLHGTGLSAAELGALVHYLRTLPGPPRQATALSDVVRRGEALYHRSDIGCGDCHDPDGNVDGLQHAVSGKTETDTPSLRFVAGAAPYFHDGKYQTLDDLLVHTRVAMGQTGKVLDEGERTDLIAYLETL